MLLINIHFSGPNFSCGGSLEKFGGGGENRTRVPKHQNKGFYMFILIFNFPFKASIGGIPKEYPLKISSVRAKG